MHLFRPPARSIHAVFAGLAFALGMLALGTLAGCTSSSSTQAKPKKVEQVETKPVATQGEVLSESWQAYFLHGSKVGYGHAREMKVDTPDGPRLQTVLEQTLRVKRYNQFTEQSILAEAEKSKDGQLATLRSSYAGNGTKIESEGSVSDGMLSLATITQGRRSTSSIPFEGIGGYFELEDSLKAQPLKPGEVRKVKSLQPVVHLVSEESLTAKDYEEVDLLGEKKQLLHVEETMMLAGQKIVRTLWCDEKGIVWKVVTPATGEENYRTTREIATAESDGAFDLGLATLVRLKEPLENPHDTKRVVYRVRLKSGNPAEVFSQGGSQAIEAIEEHTAKITVQRVTPTEPEQIEPPSSAPSDSDLGSNSLIQSDDPGITKMAAELAAKETDPAKVAALLEQGVDARLTNKNFSQAFATAADVVKSLEGDCTEHAVLLAALLRASKIPARVAAGLVYYPKEQAFAYHMWTEAWLNDRWVPLDATLGQGGIGGAHLKLFDSHLDGVAPFGAFLPVMNVMGQLEIEVVEAE